MWNGSSYSDGETRSSVTHRHRNCKTAGFPNAKKIISVTESQNGRGWKGSLWVIYCNPSAEAGSPRAGCTSFRPYFNR